MEPADRSERPAPGDREPPRVVEATHEVGREHHGASLLDLLDAVWGPVDRPRVHRATQRREVLLNGEPGGPSVTLRTGDLVELLLAPDALQRDTAARLPVLHRDERLLVADKPPGMPFDAGRGRKGSSAVERLRERLADGPAPHPVHRLDKETSGVVVLALGRDAARELTAALAAGDAWVDYTAVIRWPPAEDAGSIDAPLLHGRRSDQRLQVDEDHGHAAVTHWRIVERVGDFAVLSVRPEGGRSRQVRAHLAALGHPVLGDAAYGEDPRILLSQLKLDYRPKRGKPERPLLERPALHAARFVEPGRDLTVEAPLPRDLEVLLAQLRRLAAG